MYKQSNVSSELLDAMVKAAENAKPRDFRNDFIDQITPILTSKPQTLEEVFKNVLKTAQFEDPIGGAPTAEEAGLDAGADAGIPEVGAEDELGAEPGLEGDVGEELGAEVGGGSIADQLRSLADQVEQLEGGGAGDELGGELGDDVDISGVDEEIPADTGIGDMVGSEEPIDLGGEAKPMAAPGGAPMYMAMAKQLKKSAMLVSSKGISAVGKRRS